MKKRIGFIGLLLFLLIISGCDILNPVKSSNALLSSLSIEGASLDEDFSSEKTDYTAFLASSISSIKIIATAQDASASISYSQNPIQLVSGKNVITITVKAEDGTSKNYSITIWKGNTTINAIDSVAGSYLTNTVVYNVYKNGIHQYKINKGLAENQPIYLEENIPYTLVASAEKRASSALDNYYFSLANPPIHLICPKLEMSSFPAEAPVIVSFAYTTDSVDIANLIALQSSEVTWHEFSDGQELDISTIRIIRVKAKAKSAMDATSWGGQGIMVGLDEIPSWFSGYYPNNADPDYDENTGYFTGEAYFGPLTDLNFIDGEHQVYTVIYDRASNRIQKGVRVTTTNSAPQTSVDLSNGYNIFDLYAEARTYGVSRQYYGSGRSPEALKALETGPASYRISLSFYVRNDTNNSDQPIQGFKVYRSEDGGITFKYCATVNYGYPVSDKHIYYDVDSVLALEKSYTYRVTAFADSDESHFLSEISAPVSLLPPYTLSLVYPVDNAKVSAGSLPDFKFSLSETAPWDPVKSDYFYFMPTIREKTGGTLFSGMYAYDVVNDKLWFFEPGYGWNKIIDTFGGVLSDYFIFNDQTNEITLKSAIFTTKANIYGSDPLTLRSGITYEWDIFGWWADGLDPGNGGEDVGPPYFVKTEQAFDSKSREIYSDSFSFADSFEDGRDALNGWFTLIVE